MMIEADTHIGIEAAAEAGEQEPASAEQRNNEANLEASSKGEKPVALDEGAPAQEVVVAPPKPEVVREQNVATVTLEVSESSLKDSSGTQESTDDVKAKSAVPEKAKAEPTPAPEKLAAKTVERVVSALEVKAPKATERLQKPAAVAEKSTVSPVVKVPEDEGKTAAPQEQPTSEQAPQERADEPAEATAATDGGSGAEPPRERPPTGGNGEDDENDRRSPLEKRLDKEQERERRLAARETKRQQILQEAAEVRDEFAAFRRAHNMGGEEVDRGLDAYNRKVEETNEDFPPLADYSKPELQQTPSPADDSLPARESLEREALSDREARGLRQLEQEPVRQLDDIGQEQVLVLLSSGELHYTIRVDANGDKVARINGFDVIPELQGYGIGSRLMNDLIERCLERGDIKAIEGLVTSEAAIHTRIKVFGRAACEFFDPEVVNLDHDGWEGRPDVLPMTPKQAVWSMHWGDERAGEDSELFGDDSDPDNGVWMRARLDKYVTARPWAKPRKNQEEEK
jgi:GNAT superfamily N-acetyltransferase